MKSGRWGLEVGQQVRALATSACLYAVTIFGQWVRALATSACLYAETVFGRWAQRHS